MYMNPKYHTFELALVRTFHLPSVDDHYQSSTIPVTFSSARHERPFAVTVKDDFILESSEYFFLDLQISTAPPACTVTKASPDRAIVHIKDDGETCHVCNCLSGNVLIRLRSLMICQWFDEPLLCHCGIAMEAVFE